MNRETAAIALAGSLAEHGVQSIRVVNPGGASRALMARVTDLPGIVIGLRTGSRVEWDTPRRGFAEIQPNDIKVHWSAAAE